MIRLITEGDRINNKFPQISMWCMDYPFVSNILALTLLSAHIGSFFVAYIGNILCPRVSSKTLHKVNIYITLVTCDRFDSEILNAKVQWKENTHKVPLSGFGVMFNNEQ